MAQVRLQTEVGKQKVETKGKIDIFIGNPRDTHGKQRYFHQSRIRCNSKNEGNLKERTER